MPVRVTLVNSRLCREFIAKNVSRVALLLCFFCLTLPKISSAANPAVIINETKNIQISVSMNNISGNNQQATIGTTLSQALVVKVSYTNNTGVANVPVSFAITSQPAGATGARLSVNQITTNASGQAEATFTLGTKPGQYQITASNPNVSNSPIVFTATGVGGTPPQSGEYVKDENPDLAILDYQTTISTLNIPDRIKISAIDVNVKILHTYIGDLIVTLISPSGKQHILHNRGGGSTNNIIKDFNGICTFEGEDAKGNWQLKVEDKANRDTGSLDLWKIKTIPQTTTEDWKTYNYICQSDHKYQNNYTNTWIITNPGASKMRIHFEKYDLEGDNHPYDKLYILDKNNNEIIWYSGYNKTDIWTPVVSGDVIKVKLVTDRSITAYGFKVDKHKAVGGSPPVQDTIPPAKITTLRAQDAAMNSVRLIWTAPGDDGIVGQATRYDIRYSTAPIDNTNWANATPVQYNIPVPAIAGTVQNVTIFCLQMDTLYYFGIKTIDEQGNTSELSNIASLQTLWPINIGSQTSGSLGSEGYVWYRLSLPAQGSVTVILSMDSGVNYDLWVCFGNDSSYNLCGALQSTNGIGQIDSCTIITIINRSGYVWIMVSHQSGSGNYVLTLPKIIITQVTPPNGSVSFTTQTNENRIRCIADIKPDSLDATYNSQIEWEMDDDPRDTYQSGDPPDPEKGNDVYLTVAAPNATTGRTATLSYRIRASVVINNATCTSGATYTTQDERDRIRQEYIDMQKNRTPIRTEFVNAQTYVNPGHFAFNEIKERFTFV